MLRMWREIDTDHSGAVSFKEFIAWLTRTFPDHIGGGKQRKSVVAKALYDTGKRPGIN